MNSGTGNPTIVGGARQSNPIQGIQLPENEPLSMDHASLDDSGFQMSGDDFVDLIPQTHQLRVESEDVMHISDPALRHYKMDGVDSDGRSAIIMNLNNSNSGLPHPDTFNADGTMAACNNANNPAGSMLTATTRASSSRLISVSENPSDEVMMPGTPQHSTPGTSHLSSRLSQGPGGLGKDPSGQQLEQPLSTNTSALVSGATACTTNQNQDGISGLTLNTGTEQSGSKTTGSNPNSDKSASLVSSLERSSGMRWCMIGLVGLLVLGGLAMAGIICGTGGCSGSSNSSDEAGAFTPNPSPGPTFHTSTNSSSQETDDPTQAATPAIAPTQAPVLATPVPTLAPTRGTKDPTTGPTTGPTDGPTAGPTAGPSADPTDGPTDGPTASPTDGPSVGPTAGHSVGPTAGPTIAATPVPTSLAPTQGTNNPTGVPTAVPTAAVLPVSGAPTMVIPGLSLATQELLTDFSTPQGQAFLWVSDYPDLATLPDWRKQQLFAMATFFRAFNGNNWPLSRRLNWLSYTVNECEWASIQTSPCSFQGEMEHLGLLSDRTLEGIMPPEVALLTKLEEIRIVDCDLVGTAESILPLPVVESLTNLRQLSLEGNMLSGSLPVMQVLGSSTKLQQLRLMDNMWSGTIMSELGLLTNLQFLDLSNTALTGTIPVELSALTALQEFYITKTELTGAVPDEVCELPLLATFEADCFEIDCCPVD